MLMSVYPFLLKSAEPRRLLAQSYCHSHAPDACLTQFPGCY
uniref:Uncharacterized protein n=1 Tax=Anguilla anguilla TaxID=7936 RepID=A0A0E9VLU2_ANGAN